MLIKIKKFIPTGIRVGTFGLGLASLHWVYFDRFNVCNGTNSILSYRLKYTTIFDTEILSDTFTKPCAIHKRHLTIFFLIFGNSQSLIIICIKKKQNTLNKLIEKKKNVSSRFKIFVH